MKQLITSLSLCFLLSVAIPKVSFAAFPVKEAQVETVATTQNTMQQNIEQEKISTELKKQITKADGKGGAAVSKGLYIVLALFGLGWLGMGLNDDFSGSDWIISLLLYFVFWIPGFIYTLIKMKKYY